MNQSVYFFNTKNGQVKVAVIIHLHDITDHSAHLVNVGTQKSLQEKYPQESFNIFYSQMAVQPNIKETIVFLIFVKNNESWKEIFSHVGH